MFSVLFEKCISSFWHFVVNVVEFFLNCCNINLSKKRRSLLFQFLKFGIVGLSGTILGYLFYLFLLLLLGHIQSLKNIDYILANVISWICGVYWNFTWNWKYVFTSKDKSVSWGVALFKTYITYAFTGLILSNGLAYIWVVFLNLDKKIVPIINLLFSIPINYIMNKCWAFKDTKKCVEDAE